MEGKSMNDDILKMSQEFQDRVREAAYLMWEAAGRPVGAAMQFWIDAEKQVLEAMKTATEAFMPAPKTEKPKESVSKEAKKESPAKRTATKPATTKAATTKATAAKTSAGTSKSTATSAKGTAATTKKPATRRTTSTK